MELDLLASIAITVSAALAITTLASGLGRRPAGRLRIAAALGAWFAVVVTLAATGVLDDQSGLGVRGLGVLVLLPMLVMSIGALQVPAWRRAVEAIPVSWLVRVNAIRTFGVMFVLQYAAGRLPAPFAPVAGWGDVLVGLLAIPVASMVYRRGAGARPAVLLWNTLGLLDLVTAVALGVLSSPGPVHLIHVEPGTSIMTSLPWLLIPGFLVPTLALTHLAVFYRLAREGSAVADARHEMLAHGGVRH